MDSRHISEQLLLWLHFWYVARIRTTIFSGQDRGPVSKGEMAGYATTRRLTSRRAKTSGQRLLPLEYRFTNMELSCLVRECVLCRIIVFELWRRQLDPSAASVTKAPSQNTIGSKCWSTLLSVSPLWVGSNFPVHLLRLDRRFSKVPKT